MIAQPDIVALSGVLTYLIGHAARGYAVRAGWTKAQRALIPRLAPFIGAALGYGLGVLLDGGSWQAALHGALGGALAVWMREAQPRQDRPPAAQDSSASPKEEG